MCLCIKFEEGFKEGLDEAMKNYNKDESKKKAIDGIQSGVGLTNASLLA